MTILEDDIGVTAEVECVTPIPAVSTENLSCHIPTPSPSDTLLGEVCSKPQLESPDDSEALLETEANYCSSEENLSSTETLNFKDIVECNAVEPIIIAESKQEAHPTIDPALYTIKEESEDQEILKEQSDVNESDDEALPPFLGRWRLKDRDGGPPNQADEVDIETGEARKGFWQRFKPKTLPKHWSIMVLLCVFFTLMLQSGMYYTFTVYFPELFSTFGKSRSYTSWVGSLNAAVNMLCGPISCYIITKWGCRVTIILGAIVTSSGFVLNSLAPCVESLFLSYGVIVGLGYSLIYTSSLIVLGQYFPTKLSLATTFAMMGTGVGIITLVPATQMIIDEFGWRSAYLITAAVGLFICLFGAAMFPKIRNEEEDVKSDPLEGVETHKLMSWGGMTPLHQGSLWSLNLSQHQTSRSVSVINLNDTEMSSSGLHSNKHSMVDILELVHKDEERNTLICPEFHPREPINSPCIQVNVCPPETALTETQQGEDRPVLTVYHAVEHLKYAIYTVKQILKSSNFHTYKSDLRFWAMNISGFMNVAGVVIFLILLKDYAGEKNMSDTFPLAMSVLGIGELLGRLTGGLVNSVKKIDTVLYSAFVQMVLAFIVTYAVFVDSQRNLVISAALFGFLGGQFNILIPQIPVAVYGIDKMAEVIGYFFFFCGLGGIFGPPLGIALVDWTGIYGPAFFFSAFLFCFGAIASFTCFFNNCYSKNTKELTVLEATWT